MTPALGGVDRLELEVVEGVEARVAHERHGSAVTAVASRRAASRHVLLAPEGDAAVAAPPAADVETGFVEEDHEVRPAAGRAEGELLCGRDDVDVLPAATAVLERDDAFHLGEEGVVLAPTDVQSGPEPPPALTDEDRSAGDEVAVEPFDAQPLRIAVAAVA